MPTLGESYIDGEVGTHLEATLSQIIQAVLRADRLPGLAIGVVQGNAIAFAKGFGVQRLGAPERVSMRTIFHMASISKPFVATALVQLVEAGKIQLDASVVEYLPYFKLDDDRYKGITLRQMLNHVSGMPDVLDYEWDAPQYEAGALERYVRSLTGEKLLWEPGEKYAYSNMAFEILGDVIAKVAGMPFDDYVKNHILNPAGMEASTFLKPPHLPQGWATPHVRSLSDFAWDKYPYHRAHGPSSTLHSNALEMCNWALTNLNRGSFQGRQILPPASYDLLWQPWGPTGDGRQIGLSWFIGEYRGEGTISHGGGDTGFATFLIMLPERQVAVVVLCNTIPAPVRRIAFAALDILLGLEHAPILPSASLVARKVLQEQGLEAAVESWKSLQSNSPGNYDFSPQLLVHLFEAVNLERAQDAEQLANLCALIYPQTDINEYVDYLEKYQTSSAEVAIRALRAL